MDDGIKPKKHNNQNNNELFLTPDHVDREAKIGAYYKSLSLSESPRDQHKFLLKELRDELRNSRLQNSKKNQTSKLRNECSIIQCNVDDSKKQQLLELQNFYDSYHQQQISNLERLNKFDLLSRSKDCNICILKDVRGYLSSVTQTIQKQNQLISELKHKYMHPLNTRTD